MMPKKFFGLHKKLILITVVLISGCLQNQPREKNVIGNFHTHSTYSDGTATYSSLIQAAKNQGFDFLVITDHDTVGDEIKDNCPAEKEIVCIVGEEITTSDGHILAIDISETIPSGLSVDETIKKIHDQQGIAIAAHPTIERGIDERKLRKLKNSLDAMECFNYKHMKMIANTKFSPLERLQNLSSELGIPCVYDSDAHTTSMLKLQYSSCLVTELSRKEIKSAVKAGKCKPIGKLFIPKLSSPQANPLFFIR